jgi:hypothetical protein
MGYIAIFFAGAFLCNSVPHLVCGLSGMPFPTPFAKPRGIGNSAPLLNFFWGGFNFFVGLFLLAHHPVSMAFSADFLVLLAGVLALGTHLSIHFGKVRKSEDCRARPE